MMKFNEAKIYFDAGNLRKAVVKKADPLFNKSAGFNLILLKKSKAQCFYIESQRSKDPKVFKSIDAAVNAALLIGFNEVIFEK